MGIDRRCARASGRRCRIARAARVLRRPYGRAPRVSQVRAIPRYSELSDTFGDPIWLGGTRSLQLTIFAELFCSLAVVLGLATRLALIPLIWTMTVAAFIVHASDPLARKELALVYLAAFVGLLFLGPGRYSVDAVVRRKLDSE